MKHYLIYKITNNINGKIYIGQHTTDNPQDDYMGSGYMIHRAINKYGVENFTKEILYYCTDWYTMNELEGVIVNQEFVDREDTYNIAVGGWGGVGSKPKSDEWKKKMSEKRKGYIFSEETKRKMSEARKGKHRSEETRKKMSEAKKGHPVSDSVRERIGKAHKGIPRSEETRRKISEALKGRPSHNKGKPMSEEQKRKLSESHKRRASESAL